MVLVMTVLFVGLIIASTAYVNRQSTQSINQEREEVAFSAADAGVQYAWWLIQPGGADIAPDDLRSDPPSAATDHEITNSEGSFAGVFSLTFLAGESDELEIVSEGRAQSNSDYCQTIEAKFVETVDGDYLISEWDHLTKISCE
jgi:hypothetical protein